MFSVSLLYYIMFNAVTDGKMEEIIFSSGELCNEWWQIIIKYNNITILQYNSMRIELKSKISILTDVN